MSAVLDMVNPREGIPVGVGARRDTRASDVDTAPSDHLGSMLREYMDVTQRLAQTHETLAREVVRLRSELEHKNRELERRERLAALGEMAAGVAHEVRNPLGAIQLYNGLLRKHFGDAEPAVELLDKIDAGIQAIDDVVQDTLALAPRGGAVIPQKLRPIVESVHESCRAAIATRAIRYEVTFEDEQVEAPVEQRALQRVLINLISNAVDASQVGAALRVHVSSDVDGEVTLSILDEGTGIAPEILERIFDPFFTTKPTGTGLGLSIAHRLVEAHGGRLSAANRPEKGAEFTIVLPTSAATTEVAASSAA